MSRLRPPAVLVFSIALTAAFFAPVSANASDTYVNPQGGITSAPKNTSPRTGSVEESRRIAMQRGAVADTDLADLAKIDETHESLAAAEDGPPQALLDECLKGEEAGEVGGRVLFRHFWCQRNVVHGEYYFNGKKEGEFTVQFRTAAIGNPYTREVHYFFHGDDYDTEGSFSGWSTLALKVDCTDLRVGCSADQGYVTKDVGDWDDGDWVRWNLKSDKNVATQQPEKVLRNLFTSSGYAIDDFGRTVELSSLTKPSFRCDSAPYFDREPESCVFTDVLPRFNMLYGQNYDEVVNHVRSAYRAPQTTHPPKAGKKVPGGWGLVPDTNALHRVPYQGDTWKKNSRAKDQACATLPPKQEGQDCDEFPFATTREGAGFGDGNFSVKYLKASQNRSAGQATTTYYRWDRILYDEDPNVDGTLDEFWVNVP